MERPPATQTQLAESAWHGLVWQAHAFKEGLKLNPADEVLQQGFWDAMTLLSQHRVCLPMRYQQSAFASAHAASADKSSKS